MEISPIRLFFLLIWSFALGLGIGVLYDSYRIVRMLLGVQYLKKTSKDFFKKPLPFLRRPLGEIRQGKVKRIVLACLIFLQDVFLFCAAGVGVVILNYAFNDGQFRIYTVGALVIGFFIYYFTIGKLVIYLSDRILFFLRAIFSIIFSLLLRPLTVFFSFLGNFAKKVQLNLQKAIANRQKKVYNIRKEKDYRKASEHGFV